MKISFSFTLTAAYAGANEFSLQEANRFARLAQVAYCSDAPNIRDWTCSGCVDSQIPISGSVQIFNGGLQDSCQVLVARMAQQPGCFVSFRGSINAWNWVRNLEFLPTSKTGLSDCHGCEVHRGFHHYWQDMKELTLTGLRNIGCTPHTNNVIYMTGHSLGGAVAQFAAFDLAKLGFAISKMYTFEAPRVGNKEFADAYNALLGQHIPNFRITHHTDPCVHFPPKALGYHHVDTEVYFDGVGSNFVVCDPGDDKSCADQYSGLPNPFHMHDHCVNDAFGPGFRFCRHSHACESPAAIDISV